MGRLAGRLRRQASSHNWTECIRKIWVGWQAAFAGKPAPTIWTECIQKRWVGRQAAFASKLAPTIGLSASERDRSAVRPPSRASLAPTIGLSASNRDGLAGWQAAFASKPRSHNWTECIRKIWVGWQAAFAGKPAPTIGPSASERDGLAGRPPSRASLAPTIGLSASERYRSAGRPPSQASQLPQLDRVHPGAIGRLSGRLRGQASLLQKQNQKQSGIHRTAPHHSLGRALARLLLILLYPPLREAEWRCSSGGWARSAVRRSCTHREEVEAKPTVGDAPR